MDFKKIYSKAKGAYEIFMIAVDFYKKHEDEIKAIGSKAKSYAISVKDSWDKYWGLKDTPEIGNNKIYLEGIDVNYDEVVDWISEKDVINVKDVQERFNLNPIEAKLVLVQLADNKLLEKDMEKINTYKIMVKTSKA